MDAAFPLRYVVLKHDGIPSPHFDLMFETSIGSDLASARLDAWPPNSITRIANHRRAYLDYEGEVSGGRGQVTCIASGNCAVKGLKDGSLDLSSEDGLRIVIPPITKV